MNTVDIHTHLLSSEVSFDRLYDKVAMRFFGPGLGVDRKSLSRDPYKAYLSALINSVRSSQYVEKICLFGVDGRFDTSGKELDRDRTVCATNEEVIAVAREHADCVIPFFSINPLRSDALDLIDEYTEQGCRGVKFLQNYWGIDLNHRRFLPFFEKLVKNNLPLIIHIGSEYSIQSNSACEGTDMLTQPLAAGVRTIAAHMGLGRMDHKLILWRNLSRNPAYFDRDYFRLLELLESEENLFADTSAILAPLRARALRHLSRQYQVHDKILFGTDYPVPFTIRHNSYDLPNRNRRQIGGIANPFDRYIAAILEYFPEESPIYSNYKKIFSANSLSD